MKITNDIRITKEGKKRIDTLLNSPLVDNYHKTLIKTIKHNMPKNVSKSDTEVFKAISNQYEGVV